MGWFTRSRPSDAIVARDREWKAALSAGVLPAHVAQRLDDARAGRAAWVATMTPAELLLARTHGIRPVATVSGTCWFQYGWSWTEGHAQGWHTALDRLRQEARAAGANAVVDVRMRTLSHRFGASMDFTLLGTAVLVDGLPASPEPAVATVPALEFVRLLEADIVPVGIAVGAQYDWFPPQWGGGWASGWQTQQAVQSWTSQPLPELTQFWERIRRDAHAELRRAAASQGNGVLAHTHLGQLIRQEREKQPPRYLGRHIVIGTVVDTRAGAPVPMAIDPVVDMVDGPSPLARSDGPRHAGYGDLGDTEGAI
ncbi:heavy metal-binding domain-containing protein [Sphingomonas bacterium]|uniref:heavy metal-binding domain-containing protein n=1 Tax=Sphingomonas bacterium TaxID=1895847 RepID=UPI001574F8CB|nr:heavy metal-binding domain-containing protein [Sphingomonas bacterium]